MKTSFKAKIIIETSVYEMRKDVNPISNELSFNKIKEHINHKKIDVEMIDDCLSNDTEPVILIKLK